MRPEPAQAGTGEGLSGGEACEEDCGDAGEQQILRDAQDDSSKERSWTGWRGFCWAENVGIGTGFEDGGFAGGEFDATGV